jgi:membrane associated rhomboid family serine protease
MLDAEYQKSRSRDQRLIDSDLDRPLDARLRARWRQRMIEWRMGQKLDPNLHLMEPRPEDFYPTAKKLPSGFEKFPEPGSAWVANILMIAITVASLLHWLTPRPVVSRFVASRALVFGDQQVWRLLTALGGHGDLMHLLHNAPIFWFFAWILNGYFGWVVAGVASISIGILSNALTIWFYPDHVQLLGASGMVYGMVGMWLTLYVRFDRNGWWVKRVMRSLGFSLLVFFPQTYEAQVSYSAHGFGFLVGIIMGLALIPYAKKHAPVLYADYYQASPEPKIE